MFKIIFCTALCCEERVTVPCEEDLHALHTGAKT
jgi:hypothetical protein